jgi:hypothetical protein
MNPTVSKVAAYLSWIIAGIFVLLPFHAFLTVWSSNLIGHYSLLRLWKEFLLLILVAGVTFILLNDAKLRKKLFSSLLSRLIALYICITFIWGFAAFALDKVTLKALGYGLIINLRFLVFFLIVWVVASVSPQLKKLWPKLLLMPAACVVIVGILQRLVLPYDFLKHFGYSAKTIYPYSTINHDTNYPRVMSTLRGANPLGAYLILILSALEAFSLKAKKKQWFWTIFGAGALLALVFSYSRSAWIGALISFIFLGCTSLAYSQFKKIILPVIVGLLIVGGTLAFFHRHNATFENLFFHTQNNSAVKTTSDQGHLKAFKDGVRDLVNAPLGQGVGTAGPASVYNNNNVRLSENYYLQIAQELGWIGMILFIVINYILARELWLRRSEILPRILLASLIGITFVNLLSHAWTDDTIAYIWWGLAGITLAPIITEKQKTHGKKSKAKS